MREIIYMMCARQMLLCAHKAIMCARKTRHVPS